MNWLMSGDETTLSPPDGYVFSFVTFNECGFGIRPHRLFRGLLHFYGIELLHLNPNEIQHIAALVMLYEG